MEDLGSQIGDNEVTHLLAQQEATITAFGQRESSVLVLSRSWGCLAEARTIKRTFLVGARAKKVPRKKRELKPKKGTPSYCQRCHREQR